MMKSQLVLVCLALVALAELCSCGRSSPLDDWIEFKQKHGKHYETFEEDRARFINFARSKQHVERHNLRPDSGYKLELNHFSDWHSHELAQLNGLRAPANELAGGEQQPIDSSNLQAYLSSLLNTHESNLIDPPKEFDWRKQANRVSAVKNQGHCGSCWAFSVTGLLEGQQVKQNFSKTLIPLSEQELVDCSKHDFGCGGGLQSLALTDLHKIGGIESETDYPYKAQEGRCHFKKNLSVMTAAGYKKLATNETVIKHVVANYGPVAIAIVATGDLVHFASGVYDGPCEGSINHAVLIVGYGVDKDSGKNYWIVKNSWSENWGDEGYYKLERGVNRCSVANFAVIAKF